MRQPNLPSAVYHCIRHSLRDYMLFHSEYQIFTEQKKNRVAVSVHGQKAKGDESAGFHRELPVPQFPQKESKLGKRMHRYKRNTFRSNTHPKIRVENEDPKQERPSY